jgi:ferritin-like metal-binding protein YciE
MRRQRLIRWLQDVHEMETHLLPILRRDAIDPGQSVEVRSRLAAHLLETERHLQRVNQALRAVGAAPSRTASDTGPGLGAPAARIFSDPVVNKALVDFAAEQCEIAAYNALITAAEQTGEVEVARLCRLNRGEDEEMADWLNAQLEILTEERLKRLP